MVASKSPIAQVERFCNIFVNISGGTVGAINAGNSNVLVNRTGGTIGPVISSSGNVNPMHTVAYNNFAHGSSILAISSNRKRLESRE